VPEFQPLLADVRTPPPGPRSLALAKRLERVECPDTTFLSDRFPVFWERALGANVWDVDGNRYIDLTAAFGVALTGHSHPAVTAALAAQSVRLVHGMGDVHPTELKVDVAERLAALAPGDCGVTLFGNAGFEAVEAALKTAVLATGRPGVLAFEGAYHGLGIGALPATWREDFRAPFRAMLNPHVTHVPYPAADEASAGRALDAVDAVLGAPQADAIGAVLVEPVQGRGGIRVPHRSFLAGLREICTRRDRLLIADEILTGLGRTGRWFACEYSDVVPDLLCVGKALAGGLPLSACIGTPAVMASWGRSSGEARHTSTFLGNPMACAAAVATLETLVRLDAPQLALERGARLGRGLAALGAHPGIADVRGLGFLYGVELVGPDGAPDGAGCFDVVCSALQQGVLVLGDGNDGSVLACMPPLCLADGPMDAAVAALHVALERRAARSAR
jgi:4-aminobutyrate aminotransferase-like enzyme